MKSRLEGRPGVALPAPSQPAAVSGQSARRRSRWAQALAQLAPERRKRLQNACPRVVSFYPYSTRSTVSPLRTPERGRRRRRFASAGHPTKAASPVTDRVHHPLDQGLALLDDDRFNRVAHLHAHPRADQPASDAHLLEPEHADPLVGSGRVTRPRNDADGSRAKKALTDVRGRPVLTTDEGLGLECSWARHHLPRGRAAEQLRFQLRRGRCPPAPGGANLLIRRWQALPGVGHLALRSRRSWVRIPPGASE